MGQLNCAATTEEAFVPSMALGTKKKEPATTEELGWEGKTEGNCVIRDGCIKDAQGAVFSEWTGTLWQPTMWTYEMAPSTRAAVLKLILDTEIAQAANELPGE